MNKETYFSTICKSIFGLEQKKIGPAQKKDLKKDKA